MTFERLPMQYVGDSLTHSLLQRLQYAFVQARYFLLQGNNVCLQPSEFVNERDSILVRDCSHIHLRGSLFHHGFGSLDELELVFLERRKRLATNDQANNGQRNAILLRNLVDGELAFQTIDDALPVALTHLHDEFVRLGDVLLGSLARVFSLLFVRVEVLTVSDVTDDERGDIELLPDGSVSHSLRFFRVQKVLDLVESDRSH